MNEANNIDSNSKPALSARELRAMLEWYQAAGVNLGVAKSPVNQFALTKPVAGSMTASSQAQLNIPKISAAPDNIKDKGKTEKHPMAQIPIDRDQGDPDFAAKSAANAQTLEALKIALNELPGCSLRVRATKMVFGDGDGEAKIIMIGKAPSRDDDLQGQAFCGKAGALLDNMLGAIKLTRKDIFLTNVVPWRPPGNRDPAPHEIAMCLPFLKRQIELIAPTLLISFGELATKSLFGENASVRQLNGNWHDLTIGNHTMQAMASLHPELLLKQPAQKRVAWTHLLKIQQAAEAQCLI